MWVRRNTVAGARAMSETPCVPWHCSECRCTWEEAEARRRRAGLKPLIISAKACSPKCGAKRSRRLHALKAAVRLIEPNHGAGWHCSECGRGQAETQRMRKRRGLQAISFARIRVCSPKCSEARKLRRFTERYGAPKRWNGKPV